MFIRDKIKSKYRKDLKTKISELAQLLYKEEDFEGLDFFIKNYSKESFNQINFEWNGKHANEFIDINMKFREKLSYYILTRYDGMDNSDLLLDLFTEQSKCDKEAWGASGYLFLIGERLLNASGSMYVLEFLESAMRSFDTYGCCTSIRLNKKKVKLLSDEINSLRLISEGDVHASNILDNGLEYINNFIR